MTETETRIEKDINTMLDSLPAYIKEWHSSILRLFPTTRRDYIVKIRAFLSYIDEDIMNVTPDMFSSHAAESFLIAIQTKKTKNGMIEYTSGSYQLAFWNVINSLYDFLENKNYIPYNYMNDVERPKNRDINRINNERIFLTKKDFKKLLNATKKGKLYKRNVHERYKNRDCLIMLLLITTGMKGMTLAEINISDIDFNTYMLRTKENVYRLSNETIKYLNLWLEDKAKIDNNEALLTTRGNKRIAPIAITRIVEKYSEVGLGYKVTPNDLRTGFCSVLYDETNNIEFVRSAVGNARAFTTKNRIKTFAKDKGSASKIMENILK